MREILFKAKREDNGEWVKGQVLFDGVTGKCYIHAQDNSVNESEKIGEEGCLKFFAFEVDPETICQQLSKEYDIWEHDIVTIGGEGEDEYFEVEWDEFLQRFVMTGYGVTVDFDNYSVQDLSEVGNRFDTPNLISWK